MDKRRTRARSNWWSQDTVDGVLANLTLWDEDGSLSVFGKELNATAEALVESSATPEWSDADRGIALKLALVAVLDGLNDWALATTQSYVMKDVRPATPWASIAGATNRAPDAARMRFDPRQAALRKDRLSIPPQPH